MKKRGSRHLDVTVVRGSGGVHQPVPHARLSPSYKAVVAGGARAVPLKLVAPWRTRSKYRENAVQHATIIDTWHTSQFLGRSGSITRQWKSMRSYGLMQLLIRTLYQTKNNNTVAADPAKCNPSLVSDSQTARFLSDAVGFKPMNLFLQVHREHGGLMSDDMPYYWAISTSIRPNNQTWLTPWSVPSRLTANALPLFCLWVHNLVWSAAMDRGRYCRRGSDEPPLRQAQGAVRPLRRSLYPRPLPQVPRRRLRPNAKHIA